jgi:hypothetical protein
MATDGKNMLKYASRLGSRWVFGTTLVLILVSLAGCSSVAVWLGLRVRLDKLPVTAVSASMVSKAGGPVVSALGPGGDGSNGGDGGDGSDGQDGAAGGKVHVWVRLESGTKPLLQIKAASGAHESLYIVDPNGGTLKILANGGSGGRGGTGGAAGRGGSGGSGFPPGSNGFDGRRGFDGQSGRGGAAGTIALSVDPAAQPYLSCINWSNRSGGGAAGPAPKITVEPVPALW